MRAHVAHPDSSLRVQCLTDAFDKSNPEHVKAKEDVELGNGLPGTRTTHEVDAAIREAGLEVRLPLPHTPPASPRPNM